jgi:hypothetical protein
LRQKEWELYGLAVAMLNAIEARCVEARAKLVRPLPEDA